MKKQNEKNEVKMNVAKPKRAKRDHVFFLYVDEQGFICEGDNGMPVIAWSKPLSFSVRSKAVYAAEFFKSIKIADDIRVFTNVA